ncbi:polygalacturonase-like [Phalaenopsis equestris]|uniref:polygalacturonase-like n=1 Tax=Phalaenopsis equestris TaxID=78828 RepID=UPI0009E54B6F|nr:polygalacturonase-like [Phalaenopsis equestris]
MDPKVFLLIPLYFTTIAYSAYNVLDFGAKADGRTDSTRAFLDAWAKACADQKPASMVVPRGPYLVGRALFQGPCRNSKLMLFIKGTLMGYTSYSTASEWITFKYVNGLSIFGGTFDARGQALWACKAAGRNCPGGSTVGPSPSTSWMQALTISQSKNVVLSKSKVKNSQSFQIAIIFSQDIKVEGIKISAPGNSPNTDGIHIHMSRFITITSSSMATGDDCISVGEGVSNAWIQNITCGPGHGISIGSLGDGGEKTMVQNVTVRSVNFRGTQNGFRVKTWATPSSGFVKEIRFQHGVMDRVGNPISIDQNYCPNPGSCPNESSGIKISKVTFSDVHGTSLTQTAIKLDCSKTNPCEGIQLTNIDLSYKRENKQKAKSFCRNVKGKNSGFVRPPSCL